MKIKNGNLVLKKRKTKINEFSFNEKIEALVISKSTKEISKMTFSGCRNLKQVVFSEKLQKIEYGAFMNCAGLEEVILPKDLKVLSEASFMDCSALKKVVLPPIKVLSKNLFRNCISLTEIVIPDTVEVIEEGCFQGCVNLEKITLSQNLKEIKDIAFKRCLLLNSVVFPSNLKKIGHRAFEGCKELKIVKFNSVLDYIGKSVFYNKVYDEYKIKGTAFCSSFTSKENLENCLTVSIPEGIEYLSLGFDGALPYLYRDRNKTCPNFVLSIEKEEAKFFMSSAYYSYLDDFDYIIKDGKFDYKKYDNQLEKAEQAEKPFVAAFRLAYPKELDEATEKVYFDLLKSNEKDVAIFAVEVNDEKVLSYILENFSLDSEFAGYLYSLCAKKGYQNLQETVSEKTKKTSILEAEKLLDDLLLGALV